MEKYCRQTTHELFARLQEPVRRLVVLAGPRQIGKTTAIQQVLGDRASDSYVFHPVDKVGASHGDSFLYNPESAFVESTYYSSPIKNAAWLVDTWQQARYAATARQKAWKEKNTMHGNDDKNAELKPFVLVYDEIQKIPDWSAVVKGLWDEDRANNISMHVVVLGSAPLLMQRGLSESLMGRFEIIEMSHWSFLEMHECFDFTLDQYIYFGGYPGPAHWVIDNNETRWREEVRHSLIEPNLVKDILALARIEKPALLRQLFELASSYSGQIVAITKLVAQLQDAGNTTTLSHYLELLRAAGLIAGVPKYSTQLTHQRKTPPKINALNTAFQSIYSGLTFAQARADTSFWGRLVESCIGAHLLNTARDGVKVFHWRESSVEVDFVLQQGQKLSIIEVKSSSLKGGAYKGLQHFCDRHPKQKIKQIIIGADDFSIAEALEKPAADWL